MSIIDTFTFIFDGDTSKLQQADQKAQQSAKATSGVIVQEHEKGKHAAEEHAAENSKLAESFDKIKEHASELSARLIEHALEVAAAFKALYSVEKLVDNFFEQAEATKQLGEQAEQMGLNVEQLDAWGQAVTRTGGTTQGFVSSIQNLNFQLERIAVTGHSRSLKFFQQLGIDATKAKNSFDLLDQVSKKFEGMDHAKSSAFGRAIGLDDGTIRLLQNRHEFEELMEKQKEFGNITKEDTEVAKKFGNQWLDIKQLFRNITIDANTKWLPFLTEILHVVERFVIFLREHKDFVIGFFIATGAAVLTLAEAFGVLDAALAFLFSPVVLIIAAIAALVTLLAFAYDDIKTFSEGGNSLIGELAKKWPVVGEAVTEFVKLLGEAKDEIVSDISSIGEWAEKLPHAFEKWKNIFKDLSQTFGVDLSAVGTTIESAFNGWLSTAEGVFGGMKIIITGFIELSKAGFRLLGDLVVDPENAFRRYGETVGKIVDDVKNKFGELAPYFKPISDLIVAIVHAMGDAFDWLETTVGRAIDAVIERMKQVKDVFVHPNWGNPSAAPPSSHVPLQMPITPGSLGFEPPRQVPLAPGALGFVDPTGTAGDVAAGAVAGQGHLAQAGSPLLTPGASSATNNVTNNITTTVGSINTQAKDAADIAASLADLLKQHYEHTLNNELANGIAY